MRKLIDEYEAKKKIYDFHKITSVYENLCNNDLDVVMLLEELPEAVVRCKDCKNYDTPTGICLLASMDWSKHDGDWFCADGERRTE